MFHVDQSRNSLVPHTVNQHLKYATGVLSNYNAKIPPGTHRKYDRWPSRSVSVVGQFFLRDKLGHLISFQKPMVVVPTYTVGSLQICLNIISEVPMVIPGVPKVMLDVLISMSVIDFLCLGV